jgi:hypothetical protein
MGVMSRAVAIVVVAACSGGPTGAAPDPDVPRGASAKPKRAIDDTPIVDDPITALAPVADGPVSWLVPGRIQLELAGPTLDAPGGNRPIEVVLLDRHGGNVRAGVRLDHARFAVWSDAARLLGVVMREHKLSLPGPPSDKFAMLRPGAKVRRLAQKKGQTQVRYSGAVEIEAWVPDDLLGHSTTAQRNVRTPSGRRTLMVIPGSIIRVEPKWAAAELATTASSAFLDIVKEIDDAWVEVIYSDREVNLHGFVSRRAPPGRVHRTKDPDVPPSTVTPNAKVASGTCLYGRRGGDPLGYLVGDQDVLLEDAGNNAWTISIDSPWGVIAFHARDPTEQTLAACAPDGSVPKSALSGP